MGATAVALFALLWRLARPAASPFARVAVVGLTLAVGATLWAERPFLLGLVALAATALAAEGGLDPRWLVPIGWVWVNVHGSFPLGLAYLVVAAVGLRFDGEHPALELRCLRWLGLGVLLGGVNPLGPRILWFPIELLQKQDVLRNVSEWQAPAFVAVGERLFLLQLGLAVLALARRPRYRDGLLLVVFLAAALLGSRNIVVASVVVVPMLAKAAPSIGSLRSDVRGGLARLLTAAGLAIGALALVLQLREPAYDLDAYPVASLGFLADEEVDLEAVRLAAPEQVGNLLELSEGPGRRVFFDDRFDMFPEAVTEDAVALHRAEPNATAALDRWEVDLVLWPDEAAVVQVLRRDEGWHELPAAEDGWALLCRAGADLGGTLGTCPG